MAASFILFLAWRFTDHNDVGVWVAIHPLLAGVAVCGQLGTNIIFNNFVRKLA
jgi:hypothetical protein